MIPVSIWQIDETFKSFNIFYVWLYRSSLLLCMLMCRSGWRSCLSKFMSYRVFINILIIRNKNRWLKSKQVRMSYEQNTIQNCTKNMLLLQHRFFFNLWTAKSSNIVHSPSHLQSETNYSTNPLTHPPLVSIIYHCPYKVQFPKVQVCMYLIHITICATCVALSIKQTLWWVFFVPEDKLMQPRSLNTLLFQASGRL